MRNKLKFNKGKQAKEKAFVHNAQIIRSPYIYEPNRSIPPLNETELVMKYGKQLGFNEGYTFSSSFQVTIQPNDFTEHHFTLLDVFKHPNVYFHIRRVIQRITNNKSFILCKYECVNIFIAGSGSFQCKISNSNMQEGALNGARTLLTPHNDTKFIAMNTEGDFSEIAYIIPRDGQFFKGGNVWFNVPDQYKIISSQDSDNAFPEYLNDNTVLNFQLTDPNPFGAEPHIYMMFYFYMYPTLWGHGINTDL